MATLSDAAKRFIVQALACYDTPSQVAEAVKEEFGIEVPRNQVGQYDPTKVAGKTLAKKWREFFYDTRKRFREETEDIPIAQRAFRLRALSRIAAKAGRYQYSQGVSDTHMEIKVSQMLKALDQQTEKDRADVLYRIQLQATEASKNVLAAELADSGRMLQRLRQQLQNAGTCSGLNDTGDDWIGVLGASWAEYSAMAGEAGRLADKVTGLQGYVRAVQK